MIDQAFQTVAEQIHGVLMPGINQAISDAVRNNIFQYMTMDQIQISCIKIALEALTIIVLFSIGKKISITTKNKSQFKKQNREIKTVKKMDIPEKLWTTDGWYWDEKKGKWIGPDFPSQKK